jgi:hypothetical protein
MDIVERLRNVQVNTIHWVKCHDAADEIERLRQRVELIEGYLNGALNLVENFSHCDTTDARKALEGK